MHTVKRLLICSAVSCCALLLWSAPQSLAAVPAATTTKGTDITASTAILNGIVKTDSTLSDCHFEYVPVAVFRATAFNDLSSGGSAPCVPDATAIPPDSASHPVTTAVGRPAAGMVFRLLVTNSSGTAVGLTEAVGFGITKFDGDLRNADGTIMTQAGARPFRASTTFLLSRALTDYGLQRPNDELKDAIVDLPAGLIGNPTSVPACTESELAVTGIAACPIGSQVGLVGVIQHSATPGLPSTLGYTQLFNMVAPKGKAALLGFNIAGAIYHISAQLHRDPSVAGGYRVRVSSLNTPTILPLEGAVATVWGTPTDQALDTDRGHESPNVSCANEGETCEFPSPLASEPKAFFTMPTSCEGAVETKLSATGWQGGSDSASFLSHDDTLPAPLPIGNDGCNALDFSPSLQARPTTNVADSPSGLDVALKIPQHEECVVGPSPDKAVNCETATAHLKDTTVTLPEGLVINPSSANGLGACSESDVEFETNAPAHCPGASKLGRVEIETPVLDHPVTGAVYLAAPYENPFDSLLALYIAVDDPISGTVAKIAGRVDPDPVSGQLSATFNDNPQLPFENLKLNFFGGAGGTLRTPATCGIYSTNSSLTPWSAPDSGPPATPSDTWNIERGSGGGVCPTSEGALSQQVAFDAGTVAPIAGAFSPLVVNLRREDGSQRFSALNLSPPPGLVGKLAGIPYCPEAALAAAAAKSGRAEEESPSCPAASYVGSVTAGAGAGPKPYYAQGRAYLTGPYKGGPLSLTIITPATAGPFDLGTIVVRTALYVNSRTAQISAVSDPLPTILEGIPLDVRSVQVRLDRPSFTLNPTSCDPSSFLGALRTTLGQTTPLLSRFQVGECGRLGLKPRMKLRLKGGTRRSANPALTAVLEPRAGDANLASVSVALPRSEFLDQSHIRTVCTRVQFAASQCPRAAIYGTATVTTPLLDYPLTGPVYLRSSDNPLPDLVPDLRGPAFQPIHLEAAGRTDSIRGGIRNTFDFVPDAPFTRLVLRMQGGKKGLLENSTNICARKRRATVRYTGHNGARRVARPLLRPDCRKSRKGKRGKKGKRAKRSSHRAAR